MPAASSVAVASFLGVAQERVAVDVNVFTPAYVGLQVIVSDDSVVDWIAV